MNGYIHLLQTDLNFYVYKNALFSLISAFVVTLLVMPPLITLLKKYRMYDVPNARKEHSYLIPTMGGIAITTGMMIALLLWFPFSNELGQKCFFFSIIVLFALGIMDDLKGLSARYKFIIQLALATLIALSGIRITSFDGLFGLHQLSLTAQYSVTILAIVGITNAFNLIDGIDGLAAGLGFMSLVTLGLFLTISGDVHTALVAFALAGGILAFLYYNFNPAKVFMGDTGSLLLGFVISVLGIRLMQVNLAASKPVVLHAPIFVLGIVLIPVFDTLRVFFLRLWKGQSPFVADKAHIHHLLTNAGFSHSFAAKVICFVHGFVLIEVYWLKDLPQEWVLILLVGIMLLMILGFKNMRYLARKGRILQFPVL